MSERLQNTLGEYYEGDPDSLWTALESLAYPPPPLVATPLEDDDPWRDVDGMAELLEGPSHTG